MPEVDVAPENYTTYVDDGTGVEAEDTNPDDRIINPFDPTLIRVQSTQLTIDLLLSRMEERELELTPDFQRMAGIWSDGAQSRLIESLLIRIPLPAFYMDATDDDRWLVVDGLQRLTTLKRFALDKSLRLTGLEFLAQLQGKIYDDLPRNFQRRIKETQVTVYLIEKGTPPEVKFNIFKRINTAGLPLSAQEIRHTLNQGSATRLLAELANSDEFKSATDHGIRDTRMADRECVLRFLAFTITPYTEYRVQDFDAFLNRSMAALNRMPERQLGDLRIQFKRTMIAATRILGRDAFRKRYSEDSVRRPINKALFEAWSVNLNRCGDEQLQVLIQRKDELRAEFIELMNNYDFDSAISQATGNVAKVRLRFAKIEQVIQEVLA